MKNLIGKLTILCLCTFSLLFLPVNAEYVTAFFVVVVAGCLMFVHTDSRWIMATAGAYIGISLLSPAFCVFYPVVIYDIVKKKLWWLCGLAVIPVLIFVFPANWREGTYIFLGFMISTFLSLLIDGWLRLEDALIKTQDESKEKNLLLSEKNRNLIERQNQEIYTATLKERNRIAREIHDNVGHMLSRSILLVGALKTINQQSQLTEPLTQLDLTLNQAMNNVRESVHDLHDDSIDLRASVEELVADFNRCPCTLEYDMGRLIPNEVKYSLIAVIKESLANIIRHSDATQVQIRMREHPGFYQLLIDDNGHVTPGIDYNTRLETTSGSSAQQGMGILNMKDRIRSLHGSIQIQTTAGFHIFITIPKGENS